MANTFQQARLDPDRLKAFQPCIDNYGVGEPTDPWANNCIANDAVAYSNGLITRTGSTIDLLYDPNELALCQALAGEAARIMGPRWPGMLSASDPRTEPYFVVSAQFVPRPAPDTGLVRAGFGGALYPDAQMSLEALDEHGEWWNEIQRNAAECEEDESDFDAKTEVIDPWRSVIRWFAERSELHGSSFVQISTKQRGSVRGGCVHPWFVVGLTERGSLVGLSTYLVRG